VRTELDRVFQDSAGRIVATLVRVLGPARLDLAEEALQDAIVRALENWPHAGIPDNPSGWLFRVARNRALDLIRHDDTVREKLPLLLPPPGTETSADDDEIGAALLTRPTTVAQRLVRAKRWLREEAAGVIVEVPHDGSRVDTVLAVLYLMFTTGYDAIRAELCLESIRLGRFCCPIRTVPGRTPA
jgi:RNA polymerase sigma-70 factor (ECF subfamily)